MQRGPDLKFWSGVGLALVSLAPGISDAIRTILALIGGALIVVSIVFAIVSRPSPAPSPSGQGEQIGKSNFMNIALTVENLTACSKQRLRTGA